MAVDLSIRECTRCHRELPVAEFRRGPNGLLYRCRSCESEAVQESQARRRAAMGEEAFLAHQREIVRRHRERGGIVRDRAYNRARGRALRALVARHRDEFEELLAAERAKEETTDG